MTAAQQLIQKGREEGELKGIQKGKEEGRQEGRQEEKLYTAKNMLFKLRLDLQTVSQATGLAHEQLMQLQEEEDK